MKIQNPTLAIGIAMPVVFILIISGVIFLPSFFVNPQHNFLYTIENDIYRYNQYKKVYANTYEVQNGHVILKPIATAEASTDIAPALYLYNVTTDTSQQIEYQEASTFSVNLGPSSPDGYTVSYEYGHDGIFELFGSRNENQGYFISKGSGKKRLFGISNDRYYSNQGFTLIGWIK